MTEDFRQVGTRNGQGNATWHKDTETVYVREVRVEIESREMMRV